MPNGRSGGFMIEKADLKSLLKTFPNDTVVAKVIERSTLRPASALETSRFVDECPHEQIAVEEQDHKFYVIHLSNEPEIIWLMVRSDAPTFPELRQRHLKWATEHPDWNGWIAF
jgi:hypothetical protein